jgi:hypothetical protein
MTQRSRKSASMAAAKEEIEARLEKLSDIQRINKALGAGRRMKMLQKMARGAKGSSSRAG